VTIHPVWYCALCLLAVGMAGMVLGGRDKPVEVRRDRLRKTFSYLMIVSALLWIGLQSAPLTVYAGISIVAGGSIELVQSGENSATSDESPPRGGGNGFNGSNGSNGATRPTLSGRELEILSCLASGDSNKIIARSCRIAESTVKLHLKSILRKIHVQNRTQAAIWALQNNPPGMRPSPSVSSPELAPYSLPDHAA